MEDLSKCYSRTKYKLFEDRRVALVKLEGIIVDAVNMPVATKILEAIDSVKKHDIKAMVLRINSPGGTVGASQEIYAAVKRLREKENIKVVVSFGDVAASGGVYVAAAGDKIITNPGTITGSIGVIIKTAVIKDLYQKIGVDHQVIKSGPYKDILSNSRYFTDEEKRILQELIDSTYNQFIETVATSRNLNVEHVKSFADGRIFTGLQAKEYGLVDEIGTQEDAVDLAAKLAEIKGKPHVVDMTPKKNFLQKITGTTLNEIFDNMGLGVTYSGVPLWLMPGI
ncbi:MAG TPA: signal peptide peptidase SppA [Cyanobacteria bacterium UBA9579]|nr:signal peptide peptidase SppA [Cyanobacteria bacterium UBA9579]